MGHGDGTIGQASDGRWIVRVDAGWTPRGTRRRIKRTAKTEAEAKRIRRDLLRELRAGKTPAMIGNGITVKAWADEYLDMLKGTASPSTYDTVAGAIRKWVVPTIGGIAVANVNRADLREIESVIIAAGRCSTTARGAVGATKRMLNAAVNEGHEVSGLVLTAPLPKLAKNDRAALPLDDVRRLIRAIQPLPDRSRWLVALVTGIRQGEALGLTWSQVDLDGGALDVAWQLQGLRYADRAAGTFDLPADFDAIHLVRRYFLIRPKSKAGSRIVPLPPMARLALAEWRQIAPANPWGLVWPSVNTRRFAGVVPTSDPRDRAAWHALQETAGIAHPSGRPWHVHELRHTAATLLLESGADEVATTALLGHSSIVTSRGYQHASTAHLRAAMNAAAARLELPGA